MNESNTIYKCATCGQQERWYIPPGKDKQQPPAGCSGGLVERNKVSVKKNCPGTLVYLKDIDE